MRRRSFALLRRRLSRVEPAARVRPVLLLAGSLAACAPGPLRMPDVEAAAVAMVMEGEPRTAVLASYAVDQPALVTPERDTDETLHLLFFAQPLEALGLVAGTYAQAAAGPWTRELPAAQAVYEGRWSADEWRSIDGAQVLPFSLPLESPVACAERGGCLVDPLASQCTVPCPTPPEPAPPAGPRPLAYLPCPAGWVDDAAAQACRPWSTPPEPCAAGQLQLPGEASCRAPGEACALDWAAGLDDATTTFVRPGAGSGAGTRASPVATLAEALAVGRPTVALTAGTFVLPATLAGVRVVGACAASTRLTSTVPLVLGPDAALEAVAIAAPALEVSGAGRLRAVDWRGSTTVGGALTLDDSLSGPITMGEGGRVLVQRSRVSGAPAAIAATRTASITVRDALIEGALTATSAAITVRASVLRGGDGPVLALTGSTLDLDAALVVPRARQAPLLTTGLSSVQVRRLVVSGRPGSVLIEVGGRAELQDCRFDQTTEPSTVLVAREATLIVRRTSLAPGFGRVVWVEGQGSSAIIEDLAMPELTFGGLDISAGGGIQLRRLDAVGDIVVRLHEPRGVTRPWLLEIEDLKTSNGLMLVRGAGKVRIDRWYARTPPGTALILRDGPQPPLVEATDVRIETARPAVLCGSDPLCSGAGIYIEDGSIDVERFHISGNLGPAVTVQHLAGPVRLARGVIADQAVGIALHGDTEAHHLRSLLESVVLRGVDRVCDPCGR